MVEQKTEAPRTRVEMTFNSLRSDIIDGDLAPGSRLGVERLRERYGVGSSTIREALSLLMADSLVRAEGQRGFTVSPMSIDDLSDLGTVRVLLETYALRESIENGDDDWEAGIVAAFHRLSKAQQRLDDGDEGASGEWEIRNREFHAALVSCCNSRWIHHMLGILYHHSERYRRASLSDNTIPRDVQAEHAALMETALARDTDKACQVMAEHIERTNEVLAELAVGIETAES